MFLPPLDAEQALEFVAEIQQHDVSIAVAPPAFLASMMMVIVDIGNSDCDCHACTTIRHILDNVDMQ
jgi:hypothetical protein